jgi:hypothetical protein
MFSEENVVLNIIEKKTKTKTKTKKLSNSIKNDLSVEKKIEMDFQKEKIDKKEEMSFIEKSIVYCVLDGGNIERDANKRNYQKKFHQITIHSPNENEMNNFISRIDAVFGKWKLNLWIENVEYELLPTSKRDVEKECYWTGMCDFKVDEDFVKMPFIKLLVQVCEKEKDFLKDLSIATGQNFTEKTTYLWFPFRPEPKSAKNYYHTEEKVQPKYPIYIISKGRWEERLTSKYLEWADIPYKIVIEADEYDKYSAVISPEKILIMPAEWKAEQIAKGNGGGIPVRNFVLHHSKNNGDKRHWILDDNIVSYKRYNNNDRTIMRTGLVFRHLEDFTDRFKNVMLSGHNYSMFGVSTNTRMNPITMNTRIYSSILINNEIPFEWRGVYNEDTDLSLRVLKAGFPTLLFNCFLADKLRTMTTKGGNSDTIYAVENYSYLKSHSLLEQHPDVCELTEKFGRTHHQVNYNTFKNLTPIYVDDVEIVERDDDYGLKYIDKKAFPILLRKQKY